jgi:hypothetical protein
VWRNKTIDSIQADENEWPAGAFQSHWHSPDSLVGRNSRLGACALPEWPMAQAGEFAHMPIRRMDALASNNFLHLCESFGASTVRVCCLPVVRVEAR